ncbi:hypothetical protein GCM10011428_50290 [Streptomyces violaceus]
MVRGDTPTATYDTRTMTAMAIRRGLGRVVELHQAAVGDQRGGGHLAGDAHQQRHVQIAGRVGSDLGELGAAAPAAAYGLLGAEAGDPGEARLRAGGEPGHDDQGDRAQGELRIHRRRLYETVGAGDGPVRPRSERQPSTMGRLKTEHSAFSSGSSWS